MPHGQKIGQGLALHPCSVADKECRYEYDIPLRKLPTRKFISFIAHDQQYNQAANGYQTQYLQQIDQFFSTKRMRLSLDTLLVLDAIDRRGSFAAAANELHRVPSALSYAIQKLEDDLDVQLFDRSGHRARLTEAGRMLLEEGRQLLAHANRIEERIRKIATGWESELVLAVENLIGVEPLMPLLVEFYALGAPTRLRLTQEVLGGGWDALLTGRADLAIGAHGEGPASGGYVTHLLGESDFVFAVAAHHPLATANEPIPAEQVRAQRIVIVADSSRTLPARTAGILNREDTLTVPDLQAKLAAQLAGLGIGYLPRHLAAPWLENGALVGKHLDESHQKSRHYLAWRPKDQGPALKWFIERLQSMVLPGIRRIPEMET